jgi:FkbM family methyltransferase
MSGDLPKQSASTDDEVPSFTWQRLVKFVRKPGREQYQSFAIRLQSRFPSVPIPVRLPYGGWYLAANSDIDRAVFCGGFESTELHFLHRCLRPGMTVLDIGAHHGLYSLVASKSVHPRGHVHSFEPSPRERRLLERNLRFNLRANISVHATSLGAIRGRATLFLVEGVLDGCNSLRPPSDCRNTRTVEVDVVSLDEFIRENRISDVDFIKMDVEGAELSVLQGASRLLSSSARPWILAEIADLRTQPWGYSAREILEFLEQKGFHWFQPFGQGQLRPADRTLVSYNHNLVAVPSERMSTIQPFLMPE